MNENEGVVTFYRELPARVERLKRTLDRPLTAVEKILFTHLDPSETVRQYERGMDHLNFRPARAALQDALAQMAMLQFLLTGKERVAVPASIHCDHLLQAKSGAVADTKAGLEMHGEVYDFLRDVARRYGMDFWEPGGGIIHQIILERYARPGMLMVGTDSHTPNAGGLATLAIGVGGAGMVEVLAGAPWELRLPKLIGVHLTGRLSGWTSAKDVILKLAGLLTVSGATGAIIEYFGPGAATISCTGKGTICNMGAEVGATTSLFGYDEQQSAYLRATRRSELADLCDAVKPHLTGDEAVYASPEEYFDRVIEIDLNQLEPHVNGPYSPDLSHPISRFGTAVINNDYPGELSVGLIGSCTNSSYEDLTRSAAVVRAAKSRGLRFKSKFIVTPGSEQIWATAERDGLLEEFRELGATVMASACGPCIGQWDRANPNPEAPNSIMTSYNRNFARRNDGNPNTHAFVGSPELVTAMAICGSLVFNPLVDLIENDSGDLVRLPEPQGDTLPKDGFIAKQSGLSRALDKPPAGLPEINAASERLQYLAPFEPIPIKQYAGMRLLFKAAGKCTTGFISPAGKWLRYRGHLPNISRNTLQGAENAFTGERGRAIHLPSGDYLPVAEVALRYRSAGVGQIIVGGDNYGEGSSREHAAMQPRWLGVQAVVAKSFARIHEANLKRQGIITATFADPAAYQLVRQDDRCDLKGLVDFGAGSALRLVLRHADGTRDSVELINNYSEGQVAWWRAGSAINTYTG